MLIPKKMKNSGGKIFIVLTIAATMALSGCGNRKALRQMQQFVDQSRQAAMQPKQSSLPKDLVAPTPVVFTATTARSPFVIAASGNPNESVHPLQNYPVNQLRFKGTVTQDDTTWAFVLAPDNKLYQLKLGDKIGDHYGKIIKISPTILEIQEQVDQVVPIGTPNTRIVTLQLKGTS
jgi:type IV pilus assembly protein PilP